MITIKATGDTTIYTAGKYCEEDILVKVPEGGGGGNGNELLKKMISGSDPFSITATDLQGLTSIGMYAFSYCSKLTNITIPDSVTSIGMYAFSRCIGLTSITLPDSIAYINSWTFNGCTGLTSVTIPGSVIQISSYAFDGCSKVATYDFSSHTSVPTLNNTNAFNGIPSNCKIKVPSALYDEWIAATNWSTYASYIEAV